MKDMIYLTTEMSEIVREKENLLVKAANLMTNTVKEMNAAGKVVNMTSLLNSVSCLTDAEKVVVFAKVIENLSKSKMTNTATNPHAKSNSSNIFANQNW